MNDSVSDTGFLNGIDVLINDNICISATLKENDIEVLKNNFYSQSNNYYEKICNVFGSERINAEFESYLELPFINRCVGRINMIKLTNCLYDYNLIPFEFIN